jgi:hypothetical protein
VERQALLGDQRRDWLGRGQSQTTSMSSTARRRPQEWRHHVVVGVRRLDRGRETLVIEMVVRHNRRGAPRREVKTLAANSGTDFRSKSGKNFVQGTLSSSPKSLPLKREK